MARLNPINMVYQHFACPSPVFDITLSGKTCLVTGANRGLGYACVVHLAKMGAATIIMAGRDGAALEEAAAQLALDCPSWSGETQCITIDLCSFASVKHFADSVNQQNDRLDVAILGAACQLMEFRKTADGLEEQLQVNVVSTGLLAVLLLPLIASSANHSSFKPHLTILSSGASFMTSFSIRDKRPRLIQALNDQALWNTARYNVTKLLSIWIARAISQLPLARDVIVNTVDPGFNGTSLFRNLPSPIQWMFQKAAWAPSFGASLIVWAATMAPSNSAYCAYGQEMLPPKLVLSAEGQDVERRLFQECSELWEAAIGKEQLKAIS